MTQLDEMLAEDLAFAATATTETVNLLRTRVGLSRIDIATATRASTSAVRNWESGYNKPRPEYGHRLHALAEVVSILSETLTPLGIRQWLNASNLNLGRQRPIKDIRDRRVLEAAQVLVGDGVA